MDYDGTMINDSNGTDNDTDSNIIKSSGYDGNISSLSLS